MIRRHFTIGLALAFGLTTGLVASQGTTGQTSPKPQTQTKAPARPSSKSPLKLTGCIERGPAASGASTVVPPGSPPPPPMYKLTHVDAATLKGAMPDRAAGTAGEATEIGLRADSKLQLADHVDHKVELTGKIVAGKPTTKPATGTAKGTTTAGATTAGITEVPVFEVTSVKMVASTCQ